MPRVTTSPDRPPATRRDEIAARLRIAIARTSRRLRQESRSGLTPSLTTVLATVHDHGPLTPSELAERERIARPGITRMIARLEREGLVDRMPDPVDRRSYRVSTTARGASLLAGVRKRSRAYLARALRGLSDDDLATLERAAAVLERLFVNTR